MSAINHRKAAILAEVGQSLLLGDTAALSRIDSEAKQLDLKEDDERT